MDVDQRGNCTSTTMYRGLTGEARAFAVTLGRDLIQDYTMLSFKLNKHAAFLLLLPDCLRYCLLRSTDSCIGLFFGLFWISR